MPLQLSFGPQDWERLERDWTAWWNHDLARPLVLVNGYEPKGVLPPAHDFTINYPPEMPADEVVAQYEPLLQATRFYGDAFPRWWLNYGPGIMAGFLGGVVQSSPDTVWFYPPNHPEAPPQLTDLRLRYAANNPWWQRIQEITAAAVRRWQGQVCVGFTDLGGGLDVLASLATTTQLLLDVAEQPEEVARLAGQITRLWMQYYDALHELIIPAGTGTTPWAPIWSPGRTYMLQCDFSYMISPRMFERFVAPDLAAICDTLDHGFYHLDGKGEIGHLPHLFAIERLRGIQWIPGDGAPPPEEWLPLLKRIRDAGKLCQLFVTAEGALKIVRELGGKGFCLAVSDGMTAEQAAGFLEEIRLAG